ncbi:MAG: helix-turn-helix transcriptional regulator [Bdellovibrionales bacterium]|nr:helix-turn-helix transcriptional regulator [Bdellovibrionales bacterium]
MQSDPKFISDRIRSLRMARNVKQSELDEKSGLPRSTISKIENSKREATASELVRIAQALGLTLDMLVAGSDSFVYQEEMKVIEALREIPFEDYKRILHTIEAQVYFASKDATKSRKEYLEELVGSLTQLSQGDRRPRSHFAENKRVIRKD